MIVQITDDFDLERIAESGQCFRWEKSGERTFRIPAGQFCLNITALDNDCYELDCARDEYESFWMDYFDLGEIYRDIRARIDAEQDPFLWQAAEHEKGIRILRQDPWETLITFILSQNKNIPAIRKSVDLLAKSCGDRKTDAGGKEYYAFPSPAAVAALSEKELMECRLGYRWKYVHAAAEAVEKGEIVLDQLLQADEESTIAALTSLSGVGIKVASCVSLFGLHHLDAFPIDVWMKRILAEQYAQGYPYERYAPYNGVFQQYMFAYYRQK